MASDHAADQASTFWRRTGLLPPLTSATDAMPPKQRNRDPRPAPAEFLRRLGIRRRSPAEVFTATFWQEVRRAGGDPDDVARYGGYSPQAGGVYFITERIAKRSLSTEYDFLLRTLGYLRRLGDRIPPPRRAADVGGGTGVVSMYLAASHPDCEVTVYDHSSTPTALGRRWAKAQALRRVRFEEETYGRLADKKGPGDNDLVLFLRGMDMRLPSPDTGATSLAVPDCPAQRPSSEVQTPVTAVANLLAPTGVGVIGCAWSGWGLVTLFEAVQLAGLGVDWSQIRCRVEKVEGGLDLVDALVVVRPGVPRLARCSHDEVRAFVDSARFPDGARVLRSDNLVAAVERFSGGEELLRADVQESHHGAEAVRLVTADGFLLLEGVAGGAAVWGLEDTLAGIKELLACVRDIRDECGLRRLKVNPRLDCFIRCCQLQDVSAPEPT